MWLIGLLAGAILGGIFAGASGVVLGALLGGFVGWAVAQSPKVPSDSRIDAIGRAIDDLQARVAALERRAGAPSAARAEPAETPPATPVPLATPETETARPLFPEDAAELARVKAAIDDAATAAESLTPPQPPLAPPQPPLTPPQPTQAPASPAGAQVAGVLIGALLGAAVGSLGAVLIGAFLGWALVAAVQSNNRRAARDAERLGRREPASPGSVPAESVQADSARPPETPDVLAAWPLASEPNEPAYEPPPAYEQSASIWFKRLVGGNIVAKIGVLILFFGVGFLLKYAYDRDMLPVPLRLAAVAAVGFGMIWLGWRLRETRRLYGLILQGGGIGLLYLDVFFALKVYALVGPTAGFAAFMALGVAATLLAVRQDAKVLAVLGLTGAFLAPVLAGSKTGNHVLLFSYYTLLNGFILAISWFKTWRDLNLVGFIFTFVVAVLWGAENYRPEHFATVEPFILVFFAMYLVIPILFAQRQPPELKGLVDGMLVFGTPLCAAFMQASLVKDMPYGLAWSAGVAAALYAVLALMTIRRDGMRLLGETYVALAVVFLTLAIFFAFDAYPTFALWTLEGAAVFWVGLRQRRVLARLFGIALQLGGAAYFLMKYSTYDLANPWWNAFVAGCIIIAAAGVIIARLVRTHGDAVDEGFDPSSSVALAWAVAWWSAGGVHALYHALAWPDFICGLLAFIALNVAAFELAGSRWQWPELRQLTFLHLPALVAVAFLVAFGQEARLAFARPLAAGGYWAWPLNFVVFFWLHGRQVRDELVSADGLLYRAAWLLMAVVATWDALWLIVHDRYAEAFAWGVAGVVAGYIRFRLRERGQPEPLPLSSGVLLWGVFFWVVSGLGWIGQVLEPLAKPMAMLEFFVATSLVFEACGTLLGWTALRRAAALLPLGMLLALVGQFDRASHPFAFYGWLAWPCAVALHYIVLRRHEKDDVALLPGLYHVSGLWFALVVATWETAWQVKSAAFGHAWVTAAYALIPAAVLGLATSVRARELWPFAEHYRTIYRLGALGPVAAWLGLWMLYANVTAPGSMAPLPYLPLLNPLDVAHIAVFAALWRWSRTFEEQQRSASMNVPVLAGLAFIWVNCILLRSVHYWAGVAYDWDALSRSVIVQSGFSLLWTATAFVLMLNATRTKRRQLWMVGAGLLGVVVAKLFLNDLTNTGTVERIVSFLGVGVGLLVIGYVAPVPPGDVEQQAD